MSTPNPSRGDVVRTRTKDGVTIEGRVEIVCGVNGEILVRTRDGEHWCYADATILHKAGEL